MLSDWRATAEAPIRAVDCVAVHSDARITRLFPAPPATELATEQAEGCNGMGEVRTVRRLIEKRYGRNHAGLSRATIGVRTHAGGRD